MMLFLSLLFQQALKEIAAHDTIFTPHRFRAVVGLGKWRDFFAGVPPLPLIFLRTKASVYLFGLLRLL